MTELSPVKRALIRIEELKRELASAGVRVAGIHVFTTARRRHQSHFTELF